MNPYLKTFVVMAGLAAGGVIGTGILMGAGDEIPIEAGGESVECSFDTVLCVSQCMIDGGIWAGPASGIIRASVDNTVDPPQCMAKRKEFTSDPAKMEGKYVLKDVETALESHARQNGK